MNNLYRTDKIEILCDGDTVIVTLYVMLSKEEMAKNMGLGFAQPGQFNKNDQIRELANKMFISKSDLERINAIPEAPLEVRDSTRKLLRGARHEIVDRLLSGASSKDIISQDLLTPLVRELGYLGLRADDPRIQSLNRVERTLMAEPNNARISQIQNNKFVQKFGKVETYDHLEKYVGQATEHHRNLITVMSPMVLNEFGRRVLMASTEERSDEDARNVRLWELIEQVKPVGEIQPLAAGRGRPADPTTPVTADQLVEEHFSLFIAFKPVIQDVLRIRPKDLAMDAVEGVNSKGYALFQIYFKNSVSQSSTAAYFITSSKSAKLVSLFLKQFFDAVHAEQAASGGTGRKYMPEVIMVDCDDAERLAIIQLRTNPYDPNSPCVKVAKCNYHVMKAINEHGSQIDKKEFAKILDLVRAIFNAPTVDVRAEKIKELKDGLVGDGDGDGEGQRSPKATFWRYFKKEWLKPETLEEWTKAGRPMVHQDSWTNNGGENLNLQFRKTHLGNKLNYRVATLFQAAVDSFYYQQELVSRGQVWGLREKRNPDAAKLGEETAPHADISRIEDDAVVIFPSSTSPDHRHLLDLRGFVCTHQKLDGDSGVWAEDTTAYKCGVRCKHIFAINHLDVIRKLYNSLVHRYDVATTTNGHGRVVVCDMSPFELQDVLSFSVLGDWCSCKWVADSLGRLFGFVYCPHVAKTKNPPEGYATLRLGMFGESDGSSAYSSHPGWKGISLEANQANLAAQQRVRPVVNKAREITTFLIENPTLVTDECLAAIDKEFSRIISERISEARSGDGLIKVKKAFLNDKGVEVDHGNNNNNTWAKGRADERRKRKRAAEDQPAAAASGDGLPTGNLMPRLSQTRTEEMTAKRSVTDKLPSDTRGRGKHNRRAVPSIMLGGVTQLDLHTFNTYLAARTAAS